MHEQTTPQKGPGEASNVIPFPNRNGAPKSEPERAPKRAARERLKAAHRRTACRLDFMFSDGAESIPHIYKMRTDTRRNLTRLANLVGVERGADVADTYTRAMLEIYARAARGEDVRKALGAARLIRAAVKPECLAYAPACPAPTPSAPHAGLRHGGQLLPAEFEHLLKGLPPDHHYQPVRIDYVEWESIDIYPGDILLADLDLTPADGAFSYVKEADGDFYLGYFFRQSDGTVRVEAVCRESCCPPLILRPSEVVSAAPIVHVFRHFPFGHRRAPAPVRGDDGQRLKELRRRLERLNESDDITDSSAHLRLEKEIYDLEHAQGEPSADWPEYIEDRRAV